MRIRKKLLFVLVPVIVLLTAGSIAYAAGALPFTDIAGHWAQDSIVKLAGQGIVLGHQDGTFGPDEFVTRAQVVTFLDRFESLAASSTAGGCKGCHNDSTELTGKKAAWAHSLHGTGEVFLEDGGEAGCAGCHSGGGFSAMVAAGQRPDQVTEGDPNPTPQDCRACHEIHETYTSADWALETTAAVPMYALAGNTYNGGDGNLCANCHQARRAFPAASASQEVTVTTRFGPHHGPQSAMLLGIGGADVPAGGPMAHYTAVTDTCITCHMGPVTDVDAGGVERRPEAGHTFLPSPANCVSCHPGAEDFDIGGVQTEVKAMLAELKTALIAKGLLKEDGSINVPSAGKAFPEAQAAALWNYLYVNNEDKSFGVHNPDYTKALLQAALDALK